MCTEQMGRAKVQHNMHAYDYSLFPALLTVVCLILMCWDFKHVVVSHFRKLSDFPEIVRHFLKWFWQEAILVLLSCEHP